MMRAALGIVAAAMLAAGAAAQAAHHAGTTVKGPDPALLHPAQLIARAPEVFRAKFTTTKGVFVVEVHRDWAPRGADRFYNLVKHHFYDEAAFFRVLNSPRPFMAQFGISAYPRVSAVWESASIKDDPVTQSNTRGMITFATSGPNSRTTQVFINFGNNNFLDSQGFAPFGRVVEGMEVVDKLYGEYGEGAPSGRGPDQGRIQAGGKAYLEKNFPKLDSIESAVIEPAAGASPAKPPAKAPAKKPRQ
ncbi:MAG TPA: peptidylprolyl isomerase [Candidatus Acidoferrales bacterium]|nr:peptidylprolyl isomerase [Candidatus Acidoferrales bacterium]